MRRLLFLLPLLLLVALAVGVGTKLLSGSDPRALPSALIDKPLPKFDLAALPGRSDGLASAFLGERRAADRVALVGVVAAGGLGAWAGGWVGVLAVGVGLVAAVGVVELARHRIGGFTGDVLGAAGMVTETVALVVASARW